MRAHRERVDLTDALRDRIGDNEPDLAGLGRRAGRHSGKEVTVLARPVVLGQGLAHRGPRRLLEEHVRVLLGRGDQLWLIAVRGGEDDVRSRVDQLCDHLCALRAFGYVLFEHGLHAPAEVALHCEAPDVLGVGPARVARSSDVDEPHLERVALGPLATGSRRRGLRARA